MNRPEYRNGDLFENSDFRGMFIADHQEAIGEKANVCVDELNNSTVSKFKGILSFLDSN
mgnify:CR=1 FL=1